MIFCPDVNAKPQHNPGCNPVFTISVYFLNELRLPKNQETFEGARGSDAVRKMNCQLPASSAGAVTTLKPVVDRPKSLEAVTLPSRDGMGLPSIFSERTCRRPG